MTAAGLIFPLLLVVAWYLQKRAFREAEVNPEYSWPKRWTKNPFIVYAIFVAVVLVVGFVGIAVGGGV